MKKFDSLIQRLTQKVKMSATPVTGFILGMSGTDSLVTYLLLNEVAKTEWFKVVGVHYLDKGVVESLFTRETLPWIQDNFSFPNSYIDIGHGVESDQQRWAHLHELAAIHRFWVVSTVNATEKALGTFSIMANSASIAPIISLYKSEVLEICKEYDVPDLIMGRSRVPDCICGRDEFAAENIELIDSILSNKYNGGASDESLVRAYDYIRETKKENDFKNRTPYTV